MKIYDVSLKFTCVREEAEARPLLDAGLVANYMRDAFDANPEQESLWVILLNTRNYPKGRQMVTLGTATQSLSHPREVFRSAILASASAIIVCHNHPSGDPSPSSADCQITRQLKEAGNLLGIPLLDHVIIGNIAQDPNGKGYYSFRDVGLV